MVAPREASSSRRMVHWRMTSALRGNHALPASVSIIKAAKRGAEKSTEGCDLTCHARALRLVHPGRQPSREGLDRVASASGEAALSTGGVPARATRAGADGRRGTTMAEHRKATAIQLDLTYDGPWPVAVRPLAKPRRGAARLCVVCGRMPAHLTNRTRGRAAAGAALSAMPPRGRCGNGEWRAPVSIRPARFGRRGGLIVSRENRLSADAPVSEVVHIAPARPEGRARRAGGRLRGNPVDKAADGYVHRWRCSGW